MAEGVTTGRLRPLEAAEPACITDLHCPLCTDLLLICAEGWQQYA